MGSWVRVPPGSPWRRGDPDADRSNQDGNGTPNRDTGNDAAMAGSATTRAIGGRAGSERPLRARNDRAGLRDRERCRGQDPVKLERGRFRLRNRTIRCCIMRGSHGSKSRMRFRGIASGTTTLADLRSRHCNQHQNGRRLRLGRLGPRISAAARQPMWIRRSFPFSSSLGVPDCQSHRTARVRSRPPHSVSPRWCRSRTRRDPA